MNYFILLVIVVYFPISLYLNYLIYVKSYSLNEKDLYLEFSLVLIFLLIIMFININKYLLFILLNIPLIISFILKNIRVSFILITLLFLFTYVFKMNCLVFSFYLLFYFIYYYVFKYKNNFFIYIIYFIIINIYIYFNHTYYFNYISYLYIFISILYSYIGYLFIYLGNDIIDYNSMIKDLEHEKLLRQSISMLTHELKNPICVCKGYLEMFNFNDISKAHKYLSIITSEINRSKDIIDDFSNYGKLKSIDCEEIDLKLFFDDIRYIMLPLFKKNNGCLIISNFSNIIINGDYNRLKEVFINLLKNSIEASRDDTRLVVSIIVKKYRNNVSISIVDNGIGISKELIGKVTNMFFTTKEFGTGVGLAFCKEVIELHNGIFNINSDVNKGTTFKIILPK